MMRADRLVGTMITAASVAAIIAVVGSIRASEGLVAAVIVVAMVWGATPFVIDVVWGGATGLTRGAVGPAGSVGTYTVVVHVGHGHPGAARATILAAASDGPTVVVSTDAALVAALGPIDVPAFVADAIEEATAAALPDVETDAVLFVAPGTFVVPDAARRAAGLVRSGAGWVIGEAIAFNRDAFAPDVRDRLGRQLRSSARRAGLLLWEPNATLVSADLLRRFPMEPTRPRGAWLRARAAEGVTGAERGGELLAVVGEPVEAEAYWGASVLRRRGAVADIADAVRTSSGPQRRLGAGLLLRELYAVPLALWLLVPWLYTRSSEPPFRMSTWLLVALVTIPAALRWWTSRRVHGLRRRPLEDVLATAYDAPGSALALPTVFTRRVLPTRVPLPGQPLAWAALGFTLLALVPLFHAGPPERRATNVGLAITELGVLWLFAMRAVFQRNWSRATFRVRTELPASLDGRPAVARDLSPAGVAFEVTRKDADASLGVGNEAPVELQLDDGAVLRADGTVMSHRVRGDRIVFGVAVRVAPGDVSRWTHQLARDASAAARGAGDGAAAPMPVPVAVGPPSPLYRRVLAWAAGLFVGAVAVSAVLILCLSLIGLRPLVVRSGSMEPALRAGDVVFVEDVAVPTLAVGDIVNVDDPGGDTLTHRVVAIAPHEPSGAAHADNGGTIRVDTRGDANTTGESFTVEPDGYVGRVAWSLPRVGGWIAWTGTSTVRWTAGATAVAVTVALWALARIDRRRAERR